VPVRYLLEQKLDVGFDVFKTVGGLVVTDLEEDGFHGPVRTVTESYAPIHFDDAKNTYVEGPAVLLTVRGTTKTDDWRNRRSSKDGLENLKSHCGIFR
jgi:hypothetical protein